jgi:hypothetical protein
VFDDPIRRNGPACVRRAQVRLQASTADGSVTRSFVTDGAGAVSVPAEFPLSNSPLVDIQVAGYLERPTLLLPPFPD